MQIRLTTINFFQKDHCRQGAASSADSTRRRGSDFFLNRCTQDNIQTILMAEVKKEDTAREFTVEFDEKKTKKIGEGMRQLIFENFGKLGADFRILTFQNAKGLVGVDFMLPESARVSFSTSYTSRIKHYGLLEGLQIDFVRQGWAPASDLPWHVEPSPGWSFELAIEISREKDV